VSRALVSGLDEGHRKWSRALSSGLDDGLLKHPEVPTGGRCGLLPRQRLTASSPGAPSKSSIYRLSGNRNVPRCKTSASGVGVAVDMLWGTIEGWRKFSAIMAFPTSVIRVMCGTGTYELYLAWVCSVTNLRPRPGEPLPGTGMRGGRGQGDGRRERDGPGIPVIDGSATSSRFSSDAPLLCCASCG
jgi:hypothetical protein